MKEIRPKIKVELSQTDRFIEVFSLLVLAGVWAMAIWHYRILPETIPTHANISGNIDGYGSRLTLFFIPGIVTITFISLLILSRYPHLYNYPLKVTEATAPRVYAFSVKMIRMLNLGVLLMFVVIEYMIVMMAHGSGVKFAIWLIPLILLVTAGFMVYSVRRLFKLGRGE